MAAPARTRRPRRVALVAGHAPGDIPAGRRLRVDLRRGRSRQAHVLPRHVGPLGLQALPDDRRVRLRRQSQERPAVPLEAFFPGYPAALHAVHVFVGSWIAAGLLISLVCGAAAVVLLSRVAGLDHPESVGERAVLLLLLLPPAVFLAAGYTEALFLMLALAAWLRARAACGTGRAC
ncbi:hypothetical protein ACU686_22725 [Yinghuangia aomiensis]